MLDSPVAPQTKHHLFDEAPIWLSPLWLKPYGNELHLTRIAARWRQHLWRLRPTCMAVGIEAVVITVGVEWH